MVPERAVEFLVSPHAETLIPIGHRPCSNAYEPGKTLEKTPALLG